MYYASRLLPSPTRPHKPASATIDDSASARWWSALAYSTLLSYFFARRFDH